MRDATRVDRSCGRWSFGVALFCVVALLCSVPAAAVVQPTSMVDGSIAIPGGSPVRLADESQAMALDASTGWETFVARNGEWRTLLWNALTASPHRAIGPGVPLSGFAPDAASVDLAVRAFIAANPEVFGAPQLRTLAAFQAGNVWYVRYSQQVGGMDVLDSDWEFRVSAKGSLFAFGADVLRSAAPNFTPIPIAVARRSASRGIELEPSMEQIEGETGPALVPIVTDHGLELRPVYEFEATTEFPPTRWRTLVDAATGELLSREDLLRHDVHGETRGTIHPLLPTSPLEARAFPYMNVTVAGTAFPSDASGAYAAPASGAVSVSANMSGRFCLVSRFSNATFMTNVSAPATVDVDWNATNSVDSERDAYYHVNVAHSYVKALDPLLTALDFQMLIRVDLNATCNALWTGRGINFYRAGGGCPSTATMPDIIYHEYGHGVNDLQYFQAGAHNGMRNGALHEGLADVFSAFIQDDPVGGKGLHGPGTFVRTLLNNARWPDDQSPDVHLTGLIVGGAMWELRQAIGLPEAARLLHFARYGTPDDVNAGVAMAEFFVELVIADDDDGDLTNGTPHFAEIVGIFTRRGLGTHFFIDVKHVPLADQATGTMHEVIAAVRQLAPFTTLDPALLTVVYSVNRGPDQVAPLVPTGANDQFRALLDIPPPAVVSYYLTAGDVLGQTATDPRAAPLKRYMFVVGTQSTLFIQTLEEDGDWIPHAVGDNATGGMWVRASPIGTYVETVPVQPGEDHTPSPGVACFVTGNASGGAPADENDVDRGRTTLLSPLFDATAPGLREPTIEYYRWFTNSAGLNPGQDSWQVDISADGGVSWTPVEQTTETDNSWRRVVLRIADIVPPSRSMRMRFIASDLNPPSLVEAAVDDLRLFAFPVPPEAHVQSPNGGEVLTVGQTVRLAWSVAHYADVTVDLLLSRHGLDGPFETIVSGFPNQGILDWRVTGPGTAHALFKIVARDADGNTGVDVSDAEFGINTNPRCDGARARVEKLWPPDHALVPVAIAGVTDPDGDPVTLVVTGVTSDESVSGPGDGRTCPDATIVNGTASVRAERAGGGNGRVYQVRFTAGDGRGGSCEGMVRVCVPHDAARNACVDDGPRVDALDRCGAPTIPEALPVETSLEVIAAGEFADVRYALPSAVDVRLAVYDVTGRRVAVVDEGTRSAGSHVLRWRVPGLGSCVLFYHLEAGPVSLTRSALHLR